MGTAAEDGDVAHGCILSHPRRPATLRWLPSQCPDVFADRYPAGWCGWTLRVRCWSRPTSPGCARRLHRAGYTSRGIAERIGPAAVEAVRRNDFRALLRATTDRDPLATLVRLFLGGQTEPVAAVDGGARSVAAGGRDPGRAGRELRRRPARRGRPRRLHRTTPGEDWWVLSDLDVDARPVRCGPTTCSASATRPPRWPPRPSGPRSSTALDIGTGLRGAGPAAEYPLPPR